MKRFLIITLIVIIYNHAFAQENQSIKKVDWNGYAQLRASSNFSDNTGFMLRRMKFWVKSTPEFSEQWSYKIQTTITSLQQEKFFLQDVKLTYSTGLVSFDFGQFVPEYSLQRFQADYNMPIIERAKVIDCLIPNGTMGVRDLGLQANFKSKNKLLETSLGIFNGYGIKEYRFDNKGYMMTNKTSLNFNIKNSKLQFGYSLQYRKADSLKIPKVLHDSIFFNGNDFRYNVFICFESKYIDIQSEFLNADFDGQNANGYYLLTTLKYKKNRLALSFEDYHDLIEETVDKPYYRVGYNYLIKDDRIKLSFDNFFQIYENKIQNYIASIQLQIFLN